MFVHDEPYRGIGRAVHQEVEVQVGWYVGRMVVVMLLVFGVGLLRFLLFGGEQRISPPMNERVVVYRLRAGRIVNQYGIAVGCGIDVDVYFSTPPPNVASSRSVHRSIESVFAKGLGVGCQQIVGLYAEVVA